MEARQGDALGAAHITQFISQLRLDVGISGMLAPALAARRKVY